MALRKEHTLPAPGGYSVLHDPAGLPQNRAEALIGFWPSRAGMLRPAPAPQRCNEMSDLALMSPALSYANRYGTSRLLWVSGTSLYSAGVSVAPTRRNGKDWLRVQATTPPVTLDTSWTIKARWWSTRYQYEMFFGDGVSGGQTWRYYIDSLGAEKLYYCGLQADGVPSTGSQTTGGSMTLLGTYTYYTVAVDEFGRESSPSPTVSATLTGSNNKLTVTRGANSNGGVTGSFYWRVYRKNPNGSVYYRVSQSDIDRLTTTFVDGTADTTAQAYQVGPLAGENDPPPSAAAGIIWKNRLVVRDETNPFRIRLSNFNAPTQFSAVAQPTNPADGAAIIVSQIPGDEVVGFVDHGSVLGVFTRFGYFHVLGDDPGSWRVRAVHNIGCIAPGTLSVAGSTVYWLNWQGVYRMQGDFSPQRISAEVDNDLYALRYLEAYRLQTAEATLPEQLLDTISSAFWLNHHYYISIAGRTWAFCEESGGWAEMGWGLALQATVFADQATPCPVAVFGVAEKDELTPNHVYCRRHFYLSGLEDAHGAWPYEPVRVEGDLRVRSRPFDREGAPRRGTKRPVRFIAWGEYGGQAGALDPIGTLILHCDGSKEEYPIYPPDEEMAAKGRLVEQDTEDVLSGELVRAELVFTDREVTLREQRLEYVPLN